MPAAFEFTDDFTDLLVASAFSGDRAGVSRAGALRKGVEDRRMLFEHVRSLGQIHSIADSDERKGTTDKF